MKKLQLLAVAATILSACDNPAAQTASNALTKTEGVRDEQLGLIYQHLKDLPENTQGAIALIEDGNVTYYGVIREGDELRFRENHDAVFEIGSITKVFTATLLAHLADEGQLKLTDTINNYLNVPFKDDIPLTFLQLANHTSGLPRMPSNFGASQLLNPANPYKNFGESALEDYLTNRLQLEFTSGAKSAYSNVGVGILGYSLCKITGRDYESLLRHFVTEPLGMITTTTVCENIEPKLVSGLDARGKPTSNWDLSSLVAAGGILSNVDDMVKFALAQFDTSNHVLRMTREKTFTSSETRFVGLGWHMVKTESGRMWHWHNGGTGGYRSCMALDVDARNGVIILTNISAFHEQAGAPDELCFGLMKTLAAPGE